MPLWTLRIEALLHLPAQGYIAAYRFPIFLTICLQNSFFRLSSEERVFSLPKKRFREEPDIK